ncbi:MAG: hypothetical protein V4808_10185 [Pseudomonadota bacterium]
MIFTALLLATLAPQDGQTDVPTWTIKAPDGSKQIPLGFVAYGKEADIAKLEGIAKQKKFRTTRAGGTPQRTELMVFFSSQTSHDVAGDFFKRTRKGQYGKFETGMMVVPPSAVTRKAS